MEDVRRAAILRAVVQQYISTSQPVSSSQVATAAGIQASSATVRSEMAALERDGYLQQPHTSAGRIPTDRGYRFFVDELNTPGPLQAAQASNVQQFFDQAHGEIEQMLHQTGRMLTNLTGAASVVVAREADSTTVRSFQIVTLGPRTALAIVVFSDGAVEKRSIEIDDSIDDAAATAAGVHLSKAADGLSLSAVVLSPSGNPAVDNLASRTLAALQDGHQNSENEKVFVGGASNLASSFDAVEIVRNVLTILEQQFVVVSLIRDLLDRGMTVSIGAEHNLLPLAQCSLVMAPTFIGGERRGSVAVLGPTRMDYGQAMAAVTLVSQGLGERLGTSDQ